MSVQFGLDRDDPVVPKSQTTSFNTDGMAGVAITCVDAQSIALNSPAASSGLTIFVDRQSSGRPKRPGPMHAVGQFVPKDRVSNLRARQHIRRCHGSRRRRCGRGSIAALLMRTERIGLKQSVDRLGRFVVGDRRIFTRPDAVPGPRIGRSAAAIACGKRDQRDHQADRISFTPGWSRQALRHGVTSALAGSWA